MPEDWRTGSLSEICGYSKDKVNIEDLTLETYYSTENMQPNRQGAVQATTLPTIKQTTACKKAMCLYQISAHISRKLYTVLLIVVAQQMYYALFPIRVNTLLSFTVPYILISSLIIWLQAQKELKCQEVINNK